MTRKVIYRFISMGKGIVVLMLWCLTEVLFGQTPVITVRFANPQNDCPTGEYCLDVEFKADIPDQEIFGMNVRFFYDDQLLELIDFRDYQGGYGPAAPDPPIITTSGPAGPALFNFEGGADFVNGAIQLVNTGAPPIYLDTENWTKIFQVCFNIDGPIMNLDTFCPPVVWDLEQDPANGGFLAGDDGVVITVVDPDPNNESLAADENVEQFNWQYTGNGSPPYGEPVEVICSNVNCALPVTFVYFKGQVNNGWTDLQWAVADEFNIESYYIQHSADRFTWSTSGSVDAQGAGASAMAYAFTDKFPVKGNNYYRIAARDLDQNQVFSNIINVLLPAENSALEWIITPNPVGGESFALSVSHDPGSGSYANLFDATGKLIYSKTILFPLTSFTVSDLPEGIYSLVLVTPDFMTGRKVSIVR